jgi:hypothetical protein
VGSKYRAWLLIVLVAALCGGSVWFAVWRRQQPIPPAALMKRIPSANPVVLYIDFAAMRSSGILEKLFGSKAAQDPDYLTFIDKTGFDWEQDLDAALLAFAPDGKYYLVRGNFEWKKLKSYAADQGGTCALSLCSMKSNSPDRMISFFQVQNNLMGMAVSQDETAARHLQDNQSRPDTEVPEAPVWLWVPGPALKSHEQLPTGTHMFASALERTERLTLALVPDGNRFLIKLDARCRSDEDAITLTSELSATTSRLRQMLDLEHHTPNPADLTGVLSSGSFQSTGSRVSGQWRIERAFVDKALGEGLS